MGIFWCFFGGAVSDQWEDRFRGSASTRSRIYPELTLDEDAIPQIGGIFKTQGDPRGVPRGFQGIHIHGWFSGLVHGKSAIRWLGVPPQPMLKIQGAPGGLPGMERFQVEQARDTRSTTAFASKRSDFQMQLVEIFAEDLGNRKSGIWSDRFG